MESSLAKPIFIVGSPRSGTSVLAWCLGQHPNILPVPESNWMGDFAMNVAVGYQVGAARGNLSILSAMGISRDKFFSHFGQSINALILNHRCDLDRRRLIVGVQRILKNGGLYSGEIDAELNAGLTAAIRQYQIRNRLRVIDELDPEFLDSLETIILDSESKTTWVDLLHSESKTRWVDATPEYSWHIYGLHKLFPDAVFIHIVRDVTSVVRSMLNFHRIAGIHLVKTEQEAYEYWFRTVTSCLLAERAYGPQVVLRLRYSDLLNAPEIAMRSVLEFIGERYTTACLNPLEKRINSSDVPIDFEIDNSRTDPALLERIARLCTEIEKTPQPIEVSPAASDEMEASFNERVKYLASLNSEYQRALQVIAALQKETASAPVGASIDRATQRESKRDPPPVQPVR
jgi:hypothetical protein